MSRRGGGDGGAGHQRGRGGRGGRGRSGGGSEGVSFGAPTFALSWSATAGIMEFLDKLVVVMVHGVRGQPEFVYGTLASFNEFGAIVLEGAYKEIVRDDKRATKRLGTTVVRADTIYTIGTVDESAKAARDAALKSADEGVLRAQEEEEWMAAKIH